MSFKISKRKFRAGNATTLIPNANSYNPLNQTQILSVDRIVRENPIVKLAITGLINDAFVNDPEIFWNNNLVVPTQKMQEALQSYIIPCCKENIKSIFSKGLGLVTLIDDPDNPRKKLVKFPKDNGTIFTTYNAKKEEQEFMYVRRGFARNAHEVLVLSGFGSDPTCDGNLDSIVLPLCDEDYFISTLHKNFMAASHISANPAIFTESDASAPDPDSNFRIGVFGDKERSIETNTADMFVRQKSEIEAAKMSQKIYSEIDAFGLQTALGNDQVQAESPDWIRASAFAGACAIRTLPPGQKISSAPKPSEPSEFARLKEMSQELFASVFGITRGQLISKSARTVAGAKAMSEQYTRTLQYVKKLASDLMTKFYKLMYEESDVLLALKSAAERKVTIASRKDARALLESVDVKIILPHTSDDSIDNMLVKYSVGSISKAELDSFNRASSGLSEKGPSGLASQDWPETLKAAYLNYAKGAILKSTPFGDSVNAAVKIGPEVKVKKNKKFGKRKVDSDNETSPPKRKKQEAQKKQQENKD